MATLYKYNFGNDIHFDDVEDTLLLATAAVESLHSKARLSMDLQYWTEPQQGAVIVDGGTQAGQDLAAIFTGLLRHALPTRRFAIRRIVDYQRNVHV